MRSQVAERSSAQVPPDLLGDARADAQALAEPRVGVVDLVAGDEVEVDLRVAAWLHAGVKLEHALVELRAVVRLATLDQPDVGVGLERTLVLQTQLALPVEQTVVLGLGVGHADREPEVGEPRPSGLGIHEYPAPASARP